MQSLVAICTSKCAGVGEILFYHVNISRENVELGQYRKCANFVRLCPNMNMYGASRQFNVGPMWPQAVICLKALSGRKDGHIHE